MIASMPSAKARRWRARVASVDTFSASERCLTVAERQMKTRACITATRTSASTASSNWQTAQTELAWEGRSIRTAQGPKGAQPRRRKGPNYARPEHRETQRSRPKRRSLFTPFGPCAVAVRVLRRSGRTPFGSCAVSALRRLGPAPFGRLLKTGRIRHFASGMAGKARVREISLRSSSASSFVADSRSRVHGRHHDVVVNCGR